MHIVCRKSSESVRGIGEHLEEGGGRIERTETSGGRQGGEDHAGVAALGGSGAA